MTVRQWPPGSQRRRLTEIQPGTEVLRGVEWYRLDRWEHRDDAGLYFVWWEGQEKPDTFEAEPVVTVWLLTRPLSKTAGAEAAPAA